jgi:hypothetical protein
MQDPAQRRHTTTTTAASPRVGLFKRSPRKDTSSVNGRLPPERDRRALHSGGAGIKTSVSVPYDMAKSSVDYSRDVPSTDAAVDEHRLYLVAGV